MCYECDVTQLHFSVDRDTAERLAHEAEQRGVSLSQYIASIVRRDVPKAWPEGYLELIVGSCQGAELREPEDLPLDDVTL